MSQGIPIEYYCYNCDGKLELDVMKLMRQRTLSTPGAYSLDNILKVDLPHSGLSLTFQPPHSYLMKERPDHVLDPLLMETSNDAVRP